MDNMERNDIVIAKFSWYLLYDIKSLRLIFHGSIIKKGRRVIL